MTLGTWILIGLLGGAGSIARFLIDGLIGGRIGSGDFPWGTFVVNISGAILLGVVAGAALSSRASLLAGTATIGSYTTLSTWMLETHRLAEDGLPVVAGANLVGSILAGFGALALGHLIGAGL